MKFLVDAQLPRRLADWLRSQNLDAVHTLDFPKGNNTPDSEVARIADTQCRILITKDIDFVQSFVLKRIPKKLLLLTTGNISNTQLLLVFEKNLHPLVQRLEDANFIELNQNQLIIRS